MQQSAVKRIILYFFAVSAIMAGIFFYLKSQALASEIVEITNSFNTLIDQTRSLSDAKYISKDSSDTTKNDLSISGDLFTTNIINSQSISSFNISTVGLVSATINTGQGATEVFLMDQNVRTIDAVTFSSISTNSVTSGSLSSSSTINLSQISNPSSTSNKLYNIAGDLYFNGINVTGGGALPGGSSGQTLYNDGTGWRTTSNLYHDGISVAVGTSLPVANFEVIGNTGILQSTGTGSASLKTGRFGVRHFSSSEEPYYWAVASSDNTNNILRLGGGTSLGNASTQIRFLTSANDTTLTGTERMRITSGGDVGIGEQAPGARLEIDTDAAAKIGLVIQGAVSQSANLQEWQDSGGTPLGLIASDGALSFTHSDTDEATNKRAYNFLYSQNITADPNSYVSAGQFLLTNDVAVGIIQSNAQSALRGHVAKTGTGRVAGLRNYDALIELNAGTVDLWESFKVTDFGGIDGTLTELRYFSLQEPTLNSGTFGTQYGLYIPSLTAATTNYAIYTDVGKVHFGDQLEVIGSAAADIQLIVKGAAVQSANLQEWQDSVGNITFATGDGLDGSEYVFNEQGLDIDFRWEASGVDPALFIQGSDGNVGIGTGTPGNLLTVTLPTTADATTDVMIGTSATTQTGLVIQGLAVQSANLQEWQDSAGNITFATGDGLAGSEYVFNEQGVDIDFRWEASGLDPSLFVQGSNGDVGIGTSTPEELLHLSQSNNAAGTALIVQNTATSNSDRSELRLDFERSDTGNTSSGGRIKAVKFNNYNSAANADAGLRFYTTSNDTESEWFNISYTGQVSVGDGTTSGGNPHFFIYGVRAGPSLNYLDFQVDTGGSSNIKASRQMTIQTNSGYDLLMRTNSGSNAIVFLHNATSNVHVGSAAAPSYKLHVTRSGDGDVAGFTDSDGTCTVNPTATALQCASDIRLKKDITNIDNALETIDQIQGVNFRWKNQTSSTPRYGFIAQDVEKILPALISETPDGMKKISTTNFVPIMLEAIKELHENQQSLQVVYNYDKLVTFTDGIKVENKIVVDSNIAGEVTIPNGETEVNVEFTTSYDSKPNIVATPIGDPSVMFSVDNITSSGFTIKIDKTFEGGVGFSWFAILNNK